MSEEEWGGRRRRRRRRRRRSPQGATRGAGEEERDTRSRLSVRRCKHSQQNYGYVFKFICIPVSEEPGEEEEAQTTSQEVQGASGVRSTRRPSATRRHADEDTGRLSTDGGGQSVSSLRAAAPRRSTASSSSSCEGGATPASAAGRASSRGRLSSCSIVMVTEERLTLNPMKPEVGTRDTEVQKPSNAARLIKDVSVHSSLMCSMMSSLRL